MRRPCLLLLILLCSVLSCQAMAQTTVNGVIDRITPTGIALASGETYRKMDDASVTMLGDKEGKWEDLKPGDKVRLNLNSQRRIVALVVTGKAAAIVRVERPLTELRSVEGHWESQKDATIGGRLFAYAGAMNGDEHVVLANSDGYDILEAWVGRRGGTSTERQYATSFIILGDGEELYRSQPIRADEPPVRVSVSIKGYGAITLRTRSEDSGGGDALWAMPIGIKVPPTIPVIVSPGMGERISRETPFVWKNVDDATGYLLELQCEKLSDAKDADSESRFLIVRLPARTTVYTFVADKMPKGRWRWRVHSLNTTGFLGQMDTWRTFISE